MNVVDNGTGERLMQITFAVLLSWNLTCLCVFDFALSFPVNVEICRMRVDDEPITEACLSLGQI